MVLSLLGKRRRPYQSSSALHIQGFAGGRGGDQPPGLLALILPGWGAQSERGQNSHVTLALIRDSAKRQLLSGLKTCRGVSPP